jgi:hypothetical protein
MLCSGNQTVFKEYIQYFMILTDIVLYLKSLSIYYYKKKLLNSNNQFNNKL